MYDEYYNEPDPVKRKEILDALTADGGDTETVGQMRQLFELRYTPDKRIVYADRFLRYFFDLKLIAGDLTSVLSVKRNRKKAADAIHALCLDRTDEFDRELLYREMCHLTETYISSCQEDKNYNSFIWGFGWITNERWRQKILDDLSLLCETMPEKLDLGEEYTPFKQAVSEAREQIAAIKYEKTGRMG